LLASPTALERTAGGLALGALGDEQPSARESCARLLCAYLRTPPDGWDAEALTMPRAESDVRDEITAVIARRLRSDTDDPWPASYVDFARAIFGANADLSRCVLTDACTFDAAVFTGTATFDRTQFTAADGAPRSCGGAVAPEPATTHPTQPAPQLAGRGAIRHSFIDATFVDFASFAAATFDGTATFVGARARDQLEFSYATVGRDLDLRHSRTGGLGVTALIVGGDLSLDFATISGIYAGRVTVNGRLGLADAQVALACFLPESTIGTLDVDRAAFDDLLDLSGSRIAAWSATDASFRREVDCDGTGFTAEVFTSQ